MPPYHDRFRMPDAQFLRHAACSGIQLANRSQEPAPCQRAVARKERLERGHAAIQALGHHSCVENSRAVLIPVPKAIRIIVFGTSSPVLIYTAWAFASLRILTAVHSALWPRWQLWVQVGFGVAFRHHPGYVKVRCGLRRHRAFHSIAIMSTTCQRAISMPVL